MSFSHQILISELDSLKQRQVDIDSRIASITAELAALESQKIELVRKEQKVRYVYLVQLEAEQRMSKFQERVEQMDESTVRSELAYQSKREESLGHSLTQVESDLSRLSPTSFSYSGGF